jgi:hypothetical protein
MTRTNLLLLLSCVSLALPAVGCKRAEVPTDPKPSSRASSMAGVEVHETPSSPGAQSGTSGRAWKGVARGVAWDANWGDRTNWYGTEGAKKGLDKIKNDVGVDWIAVTPFSFQSDVNEPAIRFRDGWSDLDADVKNAHARGIKVMVKPHIWSNQFWDGSNNWRGTIRMKSEEDWAQWFENYETWIVAEAQTAEELNADAFCVGLEYLESSRAHADKWRKVIAAVRKVYSGPLTYAAHESEADLPFWDDLDFIGINAYFRIAKDTEPTDAYMKERWQHYARGLADLSKKWGKQIVFTEVGFASIDGCARAPFKWPSERDTEDLGEQAGAYRTLFAVAPNWAWFGGMFIWKYKITVPQNNAAERHYVFQNKPAEAVIAAGFRQKFAADVVE